MDTRRPIYTLQCLIYIPVTVVVHDIITTVTVVVGDIITVLGECFSIVGESGSNQLKHINPLVPACLPSLLPILADSHTHSHHCHLHHTTRHEYLCKVLFRCNICKEQ